MRLVHVSRELVPYWPPTPLARAAAELPVAQMGEIDEVMVISQAAALSVSGQRRNSASVWRLPVSRSVPTVRA